MSDPATPAGPPGLDAANVESWLVRHLSGFVAPARFSLITGGHSNLTYAASDGADNRYVIRRPPLGTTHSGGHDMGREFHVLSSLNRTPVPVPSALAHCKDPSVTGAPFFVMEHVDGNVIENPKVATRCLSDPAARQRAGEQIIDVMADMHRVDVDAIGLGDAARRDDYLGRQLTRFRKVWELNKTRELPAMARLADDLVAHAPKQRHTGIVHGDYRLGNVIVDEVGTLVAVLDWELWTLGDVLADLGFILDNWYEPGDDEPQVWMEVPPTLAGGFPTRDEVVGRYAERTGFDVTAVEYYRAFQHWKVAALAEGVKRRYESGDMADTEVDFDHLNQRVLDLVTLARTHLEIYRSTSSARGRRGGMS